MVQKSQAPINGLSFDCTSKILCTEMFKVPKKKIAISLSLFFCPIAAKVYAIALLLKLFRKSLCKRVYSGRIKVVLGWNDFVAQDCNHWQRKLQTMNVTVDSASYKWTLYSDSRFYYSSTSSSSCSFARSTSKVSSFRYKMWLWLFARSEREKRKCDFLWVQLGWREKFLNESKHWAIQ